MKNIQFNIRRKLSFLLLLGFGFSLIAGLTPAPTAQAAELTTWQQFIKKKCSGSTADAAARCAADLTNDLKTRCGAPKETERYTNCWRTFIRNNGGTAGPDSSPFEEEVPVTPLTGGCGDVETSIIDCTSSSGNPIINLFLDIVNFLAIGVGVVVVGGIVWGGINIVRSNGNAAVMHQGIVIIVNAVVGLLLFIFMYAIINFLVPGGLFT